MLQELAIHDFAIIDNLALSFQPGMTALTGETGAGKSIIIDAVGLLAGGRGSVDFIRTGTAKASLEGLFDAQANPATEAKLQAYGVMDPDQKDTVLLQRELFRSGRNVCRVNGHLVNTATLKAIGETLVDIHGQNEHQQLMHSETHLGLLDAFAGDDLLKIRQQYAEVYHNYQHTLQAVKQKQANEQEWAQRLDMLKFQVNEIQSADLHPHEDTDLSTERERLANFQKINSALQESYALLSDEEVNALDQIGQAMSSMQSIADLDPDFAAIADNLQSAYYSLQDVQNDLSNELDDQEFDEGRLDEVEKRLDLFNQLKRKYGETLDEVIAYGKRAAAELSQMEQAETSVEDLDSTLKESRAQLQKLGSALSKRRHAAAKQLTKAIHEQLASLYMDKTVFSVHFTKAKDFRPDGLDEAVFYIQTNPGEEAKPLAKIASGGELSRLMLAMKTIFARSEGVTAIIFDEVDTGVSGRVAQAIANKISLIAKSSQVLCITHLPQVAAMADHEYVISKNVHDGRTTTQVNKLTAKARVDEIARMLAGEKITKLTVEHAEELLKMADEFKHGRT
ncbi:MULTISPECIES: DNA repair protein RecN [Lacticaseibacillus]|jgi:DNA repair protein RecN (Recombination protein N)|uniref:DNA repair protein RecN n=4 Tax=Lacticaseibacillus TaxID=2759736 RepID=A0AAN1EYV0_LACCA|nr:MULTISPECIES: DNA repair protein RecN [Lacticaseibacillus]OFS01078.1 DNA repair protein RecN [Lactobacillus sp. HMSC068F07]ARY91679.1 DNA repair protein RecN [Lacticaseibacillus casei]KAB1968833.1 DNA repair protein RecN [Lacticaseibacillus casei]KLI76659.1 DNA recombination protein RecN [Lacticaseibacillus casei]MDE3282588.1 DNA repair protein RecN [Lacticaseibacillus casei]